jgi:hypothetical protein
MPPHIPSFKLCKPAYFNVFWYFYIRGLKNVMMFIVGGGLGQELMILNLFGRFAVQLECLEMIQKFAELTDSRDARLTVRLVASAHTMF